MRNWRWWWGLTQERELPKLPSSSVVWALLQMEQEIMQRRERFLSISLPAAASVSHPTVFLRVYWLSRPSFQGMQENAEWDCSFDNKLDLIQDAKLLQIVSLPFPLNWRGATFRSCVGYGIPKAAEVFLVRTLSVISWTIKLLLKHPASITVLEEGLQYTKSYIVK